MAIAASLSVVRVKDSYLVRSSGHWTGDRRQTRIPAMGAELTDDLRSFLAVRRYAVLATHDAEGPVELLRGDEAREINARIRRRYLTPEALGDERIEPVFAAADDVTIRLTPDEWRAWDSKDLDAAAFGGIIGATPERWFLPVER